MKQYGTVNTNMPSRVSQATWVEDSAFLLGRCVFWGMWVHLLGSYLIKWSKVAQSCPTLCNPMDCSPPGFSVHGILQARILQWVAISFSRGSSRPRDRTQVSHIAGRRFNLWASREAPYLICEVINNCSTFLMECLWGLKESVYVKNPCRVLVLVFSMEQIFLQFFLTSLHSSPDLRVLLSVTEAQCSFPSVANVSRWTTLSCWLTHCPRHPPGSSILPTLLLLPMLVLLAHDGCCFSGWLTVDSAPTLRATWA